MSPYLRFAKSAVETLLEHQSARVGGPPDGTLCITITTHSNRTNRRVRRGRDIQKGQVEEYNFSGLQEEQPVVEHPCRMDLQIWPVLELYSDVTGDPEYRQMVVEMASVLGRHGFEPSSGLGYLGATAEFDVLRLQPVSESGRKQPLFKPIAGLPLDRLWSEAPEQTGRMIKSAYYGLITGPEAMDYNRYCYYGYDDSVKAPSMEIRSGHTAFAQTGSILIHWWGYHLACTGDEECLGWAQAMADKWHAVQHPESGLFPHAFRVDEGDEETTMQPWPYVTSNETNTAIVLLKAAGEFKRRREGMALSDQVAGMGRRLLKAMARYHYDARQRLFPQWLRLDGEACQECVNYTFHSQAEKDEALKRHPEAAEVDVYPGSGFYQAGPWSLGAKNPCPYELALGASLTGEAEVLDRVQEMAVDLMEEAGKLTSEFNAWGQWTYPASASHIKTMLLLHKMTGKDRFLDSARQLADMELELLGRALPAGKPEWWRMPFRSDLLEALLLLHRQPDGAE